MTFDQTTILIAILFVFVIVLVTWVLRLESRLKKILTGTNQENLEQGILDIQRQHTVFSEFNTSIANKIKLIDKKLANSVRGVSTIRFDASTGGGVGGSQSFATALVDERGNGVVVSTLQTRERVGVFSKPLKNGTSEYELTEEESKAIAEALQNLST